MALDGEAVCCCTLCGAILLTALLTATLGSYGTGSQGCMEADVAWSTSVMGKQSDSSDLPEFLATAAFSRECGPSVTGHRRDVLSPSLVINRITSPLEPSSVGWWMPHTRWTVKHRCSGATNSSAVDSSAKDAGSVAEPGPRGLGNGRGIWPPVNLAEAVRLTTNVHKWGQGVGPTDVRCSLAMGVMCKPDHIRATYQYITVRSDMQSIRRLQLSLYASTLSMVHHETSENSFIGLLAVVLHADGSNSSWRLDIANGTQPYRRYTTDMFIYSQRSVVAIVLMLGCHGFTGYVQFKDVAVRAYTSKSTAKAFQAEGRWNPFGLIDLCPPVLSAFTPVTLNADSGPPRWWHLYSPSKALDPGEVTLATQVSLDRIDVLERSMKEWNGPMSVAVYVPSKSQLPDTDHEWKKLYVKKKLRNVKFLTVCSVVVMFAQSANEEYPINTLRNIAIRYSPTEMILLQDADFVPSPNFSAQFRLSMVTWFNSTEYKSSLVQNSVDKTAFVVPAFEFTTHPKVKIVPPASKQDLISQTHGAKSIIAPFRQLMSPLSHQPVDYQHWYMTQQPYLINSYQDKFEPYLVLRKTQHMPVYDESFRSYGMNKVSHIMELSVAGYQFVVMPNIWAIHMPHRESVHAKKFLQDPNERLKNRLIRFQFVVSLQRQYRLGRCGKDEARQGSARPQGSHDQL